MERYQRRSSSLAVVRRLAAELAEIRANVDPFQIEPDEDCITHWEARIVGPVGTPYEGGTFLVDMTFPPEYPFQPPRVRFRTYLFHPNVSTSGAICLDILKSGSASWSPLITVPDLLRSIQSLLNDPNPEDPLNNEAAVLFKSDKARFLHIATENTRKHRYNHRQTQFGPESEDPSSHLQTAKDGTVIDEEQAYDFAIRRSLAKK